MNQNTTKVALHHSKGNQVKVTQKKLLKNYSFLEKNTLEIYSSKSISLL